MSNIIERTPLGRGADELRPVRSELNIQKNALGSVLFSTGNTRVICAASVQTRVPRWLKDSGRGWVTAEYGMLPGSGDRRISRRESSRAIEIRRLIGRSLRSVVELEMLDGFTITLDCDVLDADGGTRTASITGAWIALSLACERMVEAGQIKESPVVGQLAAVSVGLVKGAPLLDLDYIEDNNADVDMNIVGLTDGRLVEVQGTAEGSPFDRDQLSTLLDLAQLGLSQLYVEQRKALENAK